MHQRKLLGAPMTSTCQWIPNVYGHTQCVPRLGARVRCGGTLAQPTFKYAMYWDFGNEPVGISFEGPGVFFRTAVTADNNGEAVEHCVQNIRCSLCTLQRQCNSCTVVQMQRRPQLRLKEQQGAFLKWARSSGSQCRRIRYCDQQGSGVVKRWCLFHEKVREIVNRKMFED